MEIKKIMQAANEFFAEHIATPHKITSVEQRTVDDEGNKDEGWNLTIEVIEEKEYMKRYAKDEMLGVYQVSMNKKYEITSYSRVGRRFRSSVGDGHGRDYA
ncbi:gas vesicle protein GvpO [Paenibacillus sp. 1P07SE]|uniref:gas vesicle protein GvpO n=1 Tax=Paenibacillus sp. 1P07SE TaxID=3132209 RepID=UPI0039A6A6E7